MKQRSLLFLFVLIPFQSLFAWGHYRRPYVSNYRVLPPGAYTHYQPYVYRPIVRPLWSPPVVPVVVPSPVWVAPRPVIVAPFISYPTVVGVSMSVPVVVPAIPQVQVNQVNVTVNRVRRDDRCLFESARRPEITSSTERKASGELHLAVKVFPRGARHTVYCQGEISITLYDVDGNILEKHTSDIDHEVRPNHSEVFNYTINQSRGEKLREDSILADVTCSHE